MAWLRAQPHFPLLLQVEAVHMQQHQIVSLLGPHSLGFFTLNFLGQSLLIARHLIIIDWEDTSRLEAFNWSMLAILKTVMDSPRWRDKQSTAMAAKRALRDLKEKTLSKGCIMWLLRGCGRLRRWKWLLLVKLWCGRNDYPEWAELDVVRLVSKPFEKSVDVHVTTTY